MTGGRHRLSQQAPSSTDADDNHPFALAHKIPQPVGAYMTRITEPSIPPLPPCSFRCPPDHPVPRRDPVRPAARQAIMQTAAEAECRHAAGRR